MSRRFSRSSETGTPTLEQRHAAVRRAAADALARRGITVTPAPEDAPGDDWFVGSDGMQYRLYNLQLQCAQLPAQDWPRVVEGHFGRLLAGRTAARPADLDDAELLAQIRTRLNPPEVGAMVSMSYARPAFGGLLAGLSRDLPTTVHTVGDQDVAGRDLDLALPGRPAQHRRRADEPAAARPRRRRGHRGVLFHRLQGAEHPGADPPPRSAVRRRWAWSSACRTAACCSCTRSARRRSTPWGGSPR
ncbi:MAG TPA: hypothetical protein PLF91_04160 [Mycolicibacterium fallax]|nr:hypothetical protein [Mycolicibacterium fallax]